MESQGSNPIALIPDRLCSRSPLFPRALCFPLPPALRSAQTATSGY
ncbi:MAG: hypothetical protein AB4426_22200 [Xenococcaceae cyanobacterium]